MTTMHVQRPFFLKTMHAWEKKYVLSNVEYVMRYGVAREQIRYWVFRSKSGSDWAYLISGPDYSWKDAREGHIRSAVADGWVPVEVTLEYFK